jgi:hypothetical protein
MSFALPKSIEIRDSEMATRNVWYLTSGPTGMFPSMCPGGFWSVFRLSTKQHNKQQWRTEKRWTHTIHVTSAISGGFRVGLQ